MARRKRRTHGDGTVYQKRPGYWCAQVRYTGQRITASGPTADAARRGLAEKLANVGDVGQEPGRGETTVGEYLNSWIDDLRATEALKPSTWRRYESIARCYLTPRLGDRRLVDLTKQDVAALIRDARGGLVSGHEGRRASETTLHHVHAVLRVALESAVSQDLVDRNVARLLRAPAMRHRPKVIIGRAEAARLIAAAQGTPFGAAVILGVATGMREGEILGLRRGDINFETGELAVESTAGRGYDGQWELGEPKTEAGKRSISLPGFALRALREHLSRQDPPSVLVFPARDGKVMPGSGFLATHFYPTLAKAGLGKMPFHDLRHSAATIMSEMEVDMVTVSKLLGHSTPTITMKLYGHTTSTLKVRAAQKVDAALGGGR